MFDWSPFIHVITFATRLGQCSAVECSAVLKPGDILTDRYWKFYGLLIWLNEFPWVNLSFTLEIFTYTYLAKQSQTRAQPSIYFIWNEIVLCPIWFQIVQWIPSTICNRPRLESFFYVTIMLRVRFYHSKNKHIRLLSNLVHVLWRNHLIQYGSILSAFNILIFVFLYILKLNNNQEGNKWVGLKLVGALAF